MKFEDGKRLINDEGDKNVLSQRKVMFNKMTQFFERRFIIAKDY